MSMSKLIVVTVKDDKNAVQKLCQSEALNDLCSRFTVLVVNENIKVESVEDLEKRLLKTADELIEKLRKDVNRYVT